MEVEQKEGGWRDRSAESAWLYVSGSEASMEVEQKEGGWRDRSAESAWLCVSGSEASDGNGTEGRGMEG